MESPSSFDTTPHLQVTPPHSKLQTYFKIRNISRPKNIYNDGRVDKFLDLIAQLGNDLLKTYPRKWNYLVHAVIDVYKQKKKDEKEDEVDEED